ncbi:uncharacterized protein LOC106471755 isoform X1 [Limulus polyphemus]|uniref:Uncharacterized protein LOC106471755 isoform X1 n=1 Tax=Limulus polyphemus TaxID=6850 RepID=A0ABM1TMA1_LIMPO|nr:uncharacterized protein LOC106471755 isoform X1 [Limulus polyphemus]
MLMRRALILGSGLNQNIQRQPEQNNEDIFVVASNTNSEKRNAFSTDPYLQPLPRFHPNSIRKTCIGAMRNPAFFRRQFKQKPIRRPHFQMKPNLVYSKPNRHLIYAESDYSAAPFSPTAPPISFKQQKIGPFDPSYTKPYPPFQSILMHLGYPQRSSRLQYPQRPHPVYKPQGKAYYSHLFQPTAAQSVFLNQVQNNRPAPFHQQPFSYRYPFPVSFSHGKPNILPISYPNMIQDERSNSVQFQELRFLDDQESMPRMLNSQPIISESQYSPAPRTVMSQLGYYGTTVQDQSKQQIVPVFVPVPIPVPVAVADPRPLSEEESQGQQLIPFYLQDPYSEETHPKDQEHDMMMIYNERQRPEILQSPRLVASEKRPITKHFSSEEVLEKMRMLRQLILGKYFPNPITEMDYIPSKESTTSAEIKSEMIEMFVPFSSQ